MSDVADLGLQDLLVDPVSQGVLECLVNLELQDCQAFHLFLGVQVDLGMTPSLLATGETCSRPFSLGRGHTRTNNAAAAEVSQRTYRIISLKRKNSSAEKM